LGGGQRSQRWHRCGTRTQAQRISGNRHPPRSVGAARYTASDSTEYIGCGLYGDGGGYCEASDAHSHSIWCYFPTVTAAQQAAIAAINTTSYVTITMDPNTSLCESAEVDNLSFYIY
jgi:hypothetical protein